jgi:hypothetical protein
VSPRAVLLLLVGATLPTVALAQKATPGRGGYPAKPVRVLVTMNAPEVKEKLAADGAEAAAPKPPAQFREVIARETAKWDKLIKTGVIKPQ